MSSDTAPGLPDDLDDDHDVPADLVELHEILEWQAAIEQDERGDQ